MPSHSDRGSQYVSIKYTERLAEAGIEPSVGSVGDSYDCFTWGQLATLAGLKPSGGRFNAGRKNLRDAGYIAETGGLVAATPAGLKEAGEVPPSPSTSGERLALWCDRLPSPAPEMLRTLL